MYYNILKNVILDQKIQTLNNKNKYNTNMYNTKSWEKKIVHSTFTCFEKKVLQYNQLLGKNTKSLSLDWVHHTCIFNCNPYLNGKGMKCVFFLSFKM